jgi:hypothetical protein
LLPAIVVIAAAESVLAQTARGTPIGESVTAKFQVVGEGASEYGVPTIFQARVTVLEVLRGPAARKRLRTVEHANDPATTDFDYLLARVRIAGEASGTMRIPYEVKTEHFRIFDAAGAPYPTPAVRPPEPALIGQKIYPNDIRDGWLIFLITRDDQHPELFFFSGKWFQL